MHFEKNFCVTSLPLLLKSLFVIVPILIVALIALAANIVWSMQINKKKRKRILDKGIKVKIINFLVVFFSLMAYGIIGLDYNYYLLVFFIVSLLLLGAYFILEHLKLVKIKKDIWIWTTVVTVLFAILFVYCQFEGGSYSKSGGLQSSCPSRLIF